MICLYPFFPILQNFDFSIQVGSDRYGEIISVLYRLTCQSLEFMSSNPEHDRLIIRSKEFNSNMSLLLQKVTQYENQFNVPPDNSRQDETMISSLAWYFLMLRQIDRHQDVLRRESQLPKYGTEAKTSSEFRKSVALRDKFQKRCKNRYPNEP